MIALALLLLQAAPAAPAAAEPERWSILADDSCRVSSDGTRDIVVCGGKATPRLPLPDESIPDHPVASNPELLGTRALEMQGTPCAARQGGCQVGFGPPILPIVKGAVGLVKSALARKPDKTGRVAIALDDPAPAGASGGLLP